MNSSATFLNLASTKGLSHIDSNVGTAPTVYARSNLRKPKGSSFLWGVGREPSRSLKLKASRPAAGDHARRRLSVVTASTADRPNGASDFPPGTVLGWHYEVDAVLGRGGNGVTYRCRDRDSGHFVAVKACSLRTLRDWKQLDLFQREAQILQNLDHENIPRYIDSFEEDSATDRCFFLVQELAEGASLEQMVAAGWRGDEEEVARIARVLLNVLQYLGTRRPPVVHRDVKPANVVIEGGRTGGRVFLVDFGGVQAAAASGSDLPGSTVVGTYGFMAPEQFRGAAMPASDLYGLGGTLLYLLSGRPPSAFPLDRMRLDLSTVTMSPKMELLVEGLLEPVLEDRLTPEAAIAVLEGRGRPQAAAPQQPRSRSGGNISGSVFRQKTQQTQQREPAYVDVRPSGKAVSLRKPPGSRIRVQKKGPRLEIDIPPAQFDSSFASTGAFAVAWNAFVAFWTVSALAGGGVLFALFSLPFWFAGASLLKSAFGRQFLRERLEIGLGKWTLQQQLAGLKGRDANAEVDWSKGSLKEVGGRSADLAGAAMQVVAYVNGQPQTQLILKQGIESIILGEGLDPIEQEWLAEVINAHLEETTATRGEIGAFVDEEEEALGGGEYDEANAVDDEFAAFDKKLGYAATAAGERAAEEARRAGAAARTQAARAGMEAERAAEAARLQAERAAVDARRGLRRVDSDGVINLDSDEFDVLD